ncbi:uncharacterized protein LOC142354292 [Convolutriloba macropyga]|uniref:uncharacterized protein LOC142354292 n=1 Tax=Convolutriloba macropyga TaxID=536237 RepID=UPI003F522E6B
MESFKLNWVKIAGLFLLGSVFLCKLRPSNSYGYALSPDGLGFVAVTDENSFPDKKFWQPWKAKTRTFAQPEQSLLYGQQGSDNLENEKRKFSMFDRYHQRLSRNDGVKK